MHRIKTVIMGAAGRDFHNFNTVYRDNDLYDVVAFTATQIPNIEGRSYPASLAGRLYPKGIPIFAEHELEALIRKHKVDEVVFAYSDVPYNYVMDRSSHRQRGRRPLQAARRATDDDQEHQAGHLGLRRAHGVRQEPDEPADCPPAPAAGAEGGRHPPPDALRRPREAEGAALRQPRRPQEAQVHHRGDGGVRAAHRRGDHHLRRRGLRRHPRAGAGRGRRHPVGRRQQRPAVLHARPAHRRRRPAARGQRADLLPRRGEPADGRRGHHQQDRQRRAPGGPDCSATTSAR